mgnify:CR=1 FL=1
MSTPFVALLRPSFQVITRLPGVPRSAAATGMALIRHCREQLTPYKVPRHVEFRAELPKTNVGKILRKDLRSAPAPEKAAVQG